MLSGFSMPAIGYGVYQTPVEIAEDVVKHAFKVGYRHVDSSKGYHNEVPCADAIRNSGLRREDIFFTSKIPPKEVGYELSKKAIETSLRTTGLDYIDLYLIHSPYGGKTGRLGAWRALMEYKKAGKIRSIGVSNFGVHHLNELQEYIDTFAGTEDHKWARIDVGQWELHPWLPHDDIVLWARDHGVVIQAWGPLVRTDRCNEPVLKELAEKHGKTWAQVLIRWSLQKGYVPLPKSVTPHRIEENINVFDFALDEADMAKLHFPESYAPCSWDPTVSHD